MKRLGALCLWLPGGLAQAQFYHGHAGRDTLVRKPVQRLPDSWQSRVDYASFQRDRAVLKGVLNAMSAVTTAEFDQSASSKSAPFRRVAQRRGAASRRWRLQK